MALSHLETDTGTNVDISAATAVGTYTSTGNKLIMVDVSIDAVAGNGDYVMYVTRQIGGSGSAYRILPQTTMAAASGLTAISGQSGWVTVRNGDVLTCYVVGLAGDTTTPDWTTRWFELADTDISGLATSANLQTVDDNVDAIKAKTDNIPASPASAGEYTANIGAIKAKTDNLPLSPASSGEYTSALTTIQNDLDNPNQYKADVSNLALQATSLAIKGQTDKIPAAPAQTGEYNAALTAIQADLDNPTQYKADVSGLATQASVNAIPTTPLLAANYTAPDNASIAAILEDTGTTIPATLAGLATSAEVGAITMLDEVVVGTYTMQDILKILAAKMVGKATGGGTATITYHGVDDTSDVIVETVDSNGNRSAVTLTV